MRTGRRPGRGTTTTRFPIAPLGTAPGTARADARLSVSASTTTTTDDRDRDRDRDRGVLSQFEQMRIRNGECITLEVPEFRYWDSVQVVPPGRYPMTRELVLALANAHIKEFTLNVSNRNGPYFTIDEDHNRFIHSVRNVVPAGLEDRRRPPQRGEPGYDSDDVYS